MAILSKSQLVAIQQRNELELSKGSHGTYGYPAALIRDLLQTIFEERKKSKKLQRVVQRRGEVLQKVLNTVNVEMTKEQQEEL